MSIVLVIGDDPRLVDHLRDALQDVCVRAERIPEDTEGLGVIAVVVSGPNPLRTLASVRVHPRLDAVPVIVVAPDAGLDEAELRASGLRLVGGGDIAALVEAHLREVVAGIDGRGLGRNTHSGLRNHADARLSVAVDDGAGRSLERSTSG